MKTYHIRVFNEHESRLVQEQLFGLGYSWVYEGQKYLPDVFREHGRDAVICVDVEKGHMTYGSYGFYSNHTDLNLVGVTDIPKFQGPTDIEIADSGSYTLFTNEQNNAFKAGCRSFDSAEEALKHWGNDKGGDTDRAVIFCGAIRKRLGMEEKTLVELKAEKEAIEKQIKEIEESKILKVGHQVTALSSSPKGYKPEMLVCTILRCHRFGERGDSYYFILDRKDCDKISIGWKFGENPVIVGGTFADLEEAGNVLYQLMKEQYS